MKKLFVSLLFVLFVTNGWSQACLTNYRFRIPISINNPNGALNNFQVRVVMNTQALIAAGKMRIDGGDIRFTNGGGTNLSYWFDPATLNTTSTEYWVKVDNLVAGANTIYVFYGNATVPTGASGDATFELFDEFLGSALDLTKWSRCGSITNVTLSSGTINLSSTGIAPSSDRDGLIYSLLSFAFPVVVEADVISSNQGKGVVGLCTSAEQGYATTMERTTGVDVMKLSEITPATVGICQDVTDASPTSAAPSLTGIWSFAWPTATTQNMRWPSGTANYTDATHTGVYGNPKVVVVGTQLNGSLAAGSLLMDFVRVRKYAVTDPTFTLGSEEEFPVDPNPLNTGPYCAGDLIELSSTVYNGVNYVWKDPLMAIIATTPNHNIPGSTPSNTGTYTLEANVPGCPPVVTTTFVDVSTASFAGTTSGTNTVCSGTNSGSVTVSGFTGNIIRWEMANNAGGPWYTVSSTTSTISYANIIQTTYFRPVVKTPSCPEAIGAAAIITVDPATIGGFVIGGTSVCSGTNSGIVNLVFHQGNVNKWQQSIDNGANWTDIISNATSLSYTNLTTTTLYRAEIQSGVCNAVFSSPATIEVNPLPSPSFTAAAVCEGLATNFNNTSTISSGSINNYQWDFGNSGSSIAANPIYTYPSPGNYFAGLTAVSDKGCSATFNTLVTVNAAPLVDFNTSPVCLGSPSNFLAIASVPGGGTITNYFWDHDDASTSTAPVHSHTYISTGTYDVLLSVTTNSGCIDSIRKPVEIAAPVNVSFIADSVCLGQSITFINTSTTTSPSVSYSWDFGNGDTSPLNNPVYTYGAMGTYTVTLLATVTGSPTACVSSTQRTVLIYEVPAPNFSTLNVCTVDSAEFSNLTLYTGNPANVSYNWNFGDAGTSTLINPKHKYIAQGNYTVQLTATTIEGCTASNSQLISIYPMPIANYTFADVCLDQNMNFTSTSTVSNGSLSYQWDFDDASTGAVQNPIHLYTADGSYAVELIVTTNNNCRDTIVKNVVVHPKPAVDFINVAVCDGQPSTFTEATSINAGTVIAFDWDFGDGGSANGNSATHQYLNPGTYSVTLVATSDMGCVDDIIKPVTVDPVPVPSFIAQDACLNQPNVFTNSSTITGISPLIYEWNFGDGNTSVLTSPNHIYGSAGLYSVTLVVTSGAGCIDSITKVTEVYPLPTVNAGNDTTISRGDEVQLNAFSVMGSAYAWTPTNTINNSNIANPVARPLDNTTYIVTMTDVYGCQNTDQVTINVNNDYKLLIYNVVTPDDNGSNDFWVIENIDFYPEASVQIFNRWGEVILNTTAYQNDWNGVFGTDQLPDGSYYYIVSFPDTDFHYKGTITLLRNK